MADNAALGTLGKDGSVPNKLSNVCVETPIGRFCHLTSVEGFGWWFSFDFSQPVRCPSKHSLIAKSILYQVYLFVSTRLLGYRLMQFAVVVFSAEKLLVGLKPHNRCNQICRLNPKQNAVIREGNCRQFIARV